MKIDQLSAFLKTLKSQPEIIEHYNFHDTKKIPKIYQFKYKCIYFLIGLDDEVVYVGETGNILRRINEHRREKPFQSVTFLGFKYYSIESMQRYELQKYEYNAIGYFRPLFNTHGNTIL